MSKRAPRDASRVNIHEPYELRYWSEKFGVSQEELNRAVQKVGVSAKAVEAELSRR